MTEKENKNTEFIVPKIEIPLYSAVSTEFDDEIVIGNLIEDEGIFYIVKNPIVINNYSQPRFEGEAELIKEIHPNTLSIHFSSMVDSQKNKIFASLQKDGKGGSTTENYTFVFVNDRVKALYKMKNGTRKIIDIGRYDTEKVIGVQI